MVDKLDPSLKIAGLENLTVGDFWAWAYSDLVSNTIRPMFAEYLVGESLQLTHEPRVEWNCVDFRYRDRGIEVKSAGYVQSWLQRSRPMISFDIAAKQRPWDAATNTNLPPGRSAELYVLCVHTDCARESCRVHDVGSWDFYVLGSKKIDDAFGKQKTIRLSRLRAHCCGVKYADLKRTIDATIDALDRSPHSFSLSVPTG